MDGSALVVAGGVALGGVAVAALLAGLAYPFTHAGGDRNKDPEYAQWVMNICGGSKFIQYVHRGNAVLYPIFTGTEVSIPLLGWPATTAAITYPAHFVCGRHECRRSAPCFLSSLSFLRWVYDGAGVLLPFVDGAQPGP